MKTPLRTYITPWQVHQQRWKRGCGSSLCSNAQHVVLARGTIPCDVLFVGEAPGRSEDVLGLPFVGPAGHLLDVIVKKALAGKPLTVAFCNLVGCIPLDDDGDKLAQPDPEDIKQCSGRLKECIGLGDPRLLVLVGKLAEDYLTPGYRHSIAISRDIPRVSIIHPAAVLRANVANRGLMVQRMTVALRNAVEDL